VVRTPYRVLKTLFNKALQRPPAPPVPEKPVLDAAMQAWIDLLRKESARRADTHPVWRHIDQGFEFGLEVVTKERFEQGLREFHLCQADEADKLARSIYEDLEKNPVALNTLRGTKFALEVGAIAGTVAAGGIGWIDLVLAPLAASVTHHLVELFGKSYVDSRREQARARQQALVSQYIARPMAEWLAQWPTTGGSEFEQLQAALRRIPPALRQVEQAVKKAMGTT
jgi:hypothetical protein